MCAPDTPTPEAAPTAVETPDAASLLRAAEQHYERGEWRQACDLYRQSLRLDPVAGRNHMQLAPLLKIGGAREDFWDEESWLTHLAPHNYDAPAADIDVHAGKWTVPSPAELTFATNWREPDLLPPMSEGYPLEEYRRRYQAKADRAEFLVTAVDVTAGFFRDDSRFPRPLSQWPQTHVWLLKLAFLYVREQRFDDAQHCLRQLDQCVRSQPGAELFPHLPQLRALTALLKGACAHAQSEGREPAANVSDLLRTAWELAPQLAGEANGMLPVDYRALAHELGVDVEAAEAAGQERAAHELREWNLARVQRLGKKPTARALAQAFTVKPEDIPDSRAGQDVAGCLGFMDPQEQDRNRELLHVLDRDSLTKSPRSVHAKIARAFNNLPRPYCLSPYATELYRYVIRLFVRESRFEEARAAAVELSHCPWGAWVGEFWLAHGFNELTAGQPRRALAYFVLTERLDSDLVRIGGYGNHLPDELVAHAHRLLLDAGYKDPSWDGSLEDELSWFEEHYPAGSLPSLGA